ncbi:Phage integrase, N-terminal SAM-like domain [Mesorhizobium albiziae]|uniref:Phage integrase, N-terminal SAM-like domain n=1 Tax=Neomesorhizobium albiziae TaxID=335020 RepID=A0A1I4FZX3_9HYPH|nr:hypothetical protein [Mesorhizobium albiziae]GLS34118.1 hypothetical protein GCM10007937_58310 [Mesorhizobium albiziae]SFL23324.1 Phage integrase, N-terminal SAM-like domain [Mesorhizobium albiziae]
MSEHLLLVSLFESYFRRRLTKQRNATSAPVANYHDALRMLILFAATRLRRKPAALTLEDLGRDHWTAAGLADNSQPHAAALSNASGLMPPR